MAEEKLMTMDEIREVLDSLPMTSPTEQMVQMMEQLETEYPGVDWDSPTGDQLLRQRLTPWAQRLRSTYATYMKK